MTDRERVISSVSQVEMVKWPPSIIIYPVKPNLFHSPPNLHITASTDAVHAAAGWFQWFWTLQIYQFLSIIKSLPGPLPTSAAIFSRAVKFKFKFWVLCTVDKGAKKNKNKINNHFYCIPTNLATCLYFSVYEKIFVKLINKTHINAQVRLQDLSPDLAVKDSFGDCGQKAPDVFKSVHAPMNDSQHVMFTVCKYVTM